MHRLIARTVFVSLAFVAPLSSHAQLVEGRDYFTLTPAQTTSDPGRIVVTEFFSYQCPYCNSFAPALDNWVAELPDDVLFERAAVSIGRQPWAPIAQAFYALQAMGELEELDAAIFRAIHIEGARLFDKEAIVEWVAGNGIDAQEFSDSYDSFGVATFVRNAEQRSRSHRIPSIPTLVVDGTYVVPIADNGTFDLQLAGVDQLIAEIRSVRDP